MAYRRRQHQQHTSSSTSSGSSTTPSPRPPSSVSSSSSSASYSSSNNHPGLGLGLGLGEHQHQDDNEFRQRMEAYDAAAGNSKAEAGLVDVNFDFDNDGTSTDTTDAVAAKAIRASSAARRDSSLSSAYAFHHHPPPPPPPPSSSAITSTTPPFSSSSSSSSSSSPSKVSKKPYNNNNNYEYTSIKVLKESKQGFWTSLARKAKSFLDDDDDNDHPQQQQQQQQQLDSPRSATTIHTHIPPPHSASSATRPKYQNSYPLPPPYDEPHQKKKTDSPAPLKKGLNAISSSLNYIGNAVEEGLSVVENRTADIIQETRKHIKKKSGGVAAANNQATNRTGTWQQRSELETHVQPQIQTDLELQLKASRDVAMAMAAKAKLLLRELKTVKADLAFAKERCAQLEEENKVLRENCERGESPEDDDLIRLQLETLLAEKARLAHENSVYARENRFLREVVEYHQLTMQDVIYLDEGTEEVTEVYPIKVVSTPHSVFTAPLPPALSTEASPNMNLRATQDMPPHPVPPPGVVEVSRAASGLSLYTSTSNAVDKKKQSNNSL